jgi:hypothetical protein
MSAMRLFSALLRRERAEARRLGMRVAEVSREIALFSKDGERMIFTPYRCVRYALPRRERHGRTWKLLQRTRALGATLPNDFLLEASGELPAGLAEQLRRVAEDYPDELFEFEATPSEVAVYWSEWGGAQTVRRLHYHLERLASY